MTILIAYLPTPQGEAALDAGLAQARLTGEDVVIVNSPKRGSLVDTDLVDADADAAILARAEQAGVGARVDHVLHDDLSETIVELIERLGAGLVVIGLRHRTAVGKLLMGSDAQRILLDSPVPVLAVKAAR